MTARVCVVTGAAKGIGRAIAAAFVAEGDSVIAFDVDSEGLTRAAAALGPAFEPVTVDIADTAAAGAALDAVIARHGRLDVLVNNAGVTRRAPILELTEDDWDRIVSVNAKGAFFCLQHAARQMIDQGDGRIVNISSVAGRGFHAASNAIYAGTKGFLIALTRNAAHALGPHGVTVNAVCPGITETEIFQGIVARDAEAQGIPVDEVRARALSAVPVRRANTTEEVAALVVFLASDAARNVTGQSWNIDGGLMMD